VPADLHRVPVGGQTVSGPDCPATKAVPAFARCLTIMQPLLQGGPMSAKVAATAGQATTGEPTTPRRRPPRPRLSFGSLRRSGSSPSSSRSTSTGTCGSYCCSAAGGELRTTKGDAFQHQQCRRPTASHGGGLSDSSDRRCRRRQFSRQAAMNGADSFSLSCSLMQQHGRPLEDFGRSQLT